MTPPPDSPPSPAAPKGDATVPHPGAVASAPGALADHAVLLLAYGTPQSLDEVEPYLLDVRGGRPTPVELVEEIRSRYAAIGGKSPLNERTYAQAAGLAAELAERGTPRAVYVGMRHWHPYISATVAAMVADGIRHATALVLAPHYSSLSVGRYREAVAQAIADQGADLTVDFVESWWQQPAFLAQQETNLRAALAELPSDLDRKHLKVLFTAHSLPTRILAMGDPYDAELQANAQALAMRISDLELDWSFCYQSAGASGGPWLGPAIEEQVPILAAEGYTHILVQPLGFVCDHVEILFDLDIEAKLVADECGIGLSRTVSMNALPGFIHALADTIAAD